jgi:hypothetical protein
MSGCLTAILYGTLLQYWFQIFLQTGIFRHVQLLEQLRNQLDSPLVECSLASVGGPNSLCGSNTFSLGALPEDEVK